MANNEPSKEDILDNVNNAFTFLDEQRISGLEKMKALQATRNDSLEREKIRLLKKYGDFHPRVKKISDRLSYDQGLKIELANEIEKAKIKMPDFDINTWMVHGRVLNQEGTGLHGLTVSLYDENGNWIEVLGYACTDSRGYYAVRYKVDPEKKSEYPERDKLFLTITDSKFNVLHRDIRPLFVKIGRIDYRLIVLESKEDICTPPEPGKSGSPGTPPDAWIVRGNVVDEERAPISGLIVSLYDKDLLFDDVLGTTLTDENGSFIMIYRTEAFKDFFEKRPDIYLKVLDNEGKTLYSSRKKIRCNAGRVEEFSIKIRRKS